MDFPYFKKSNAILTLLFFIIFELEPILNEKRTF